MIHLQWFISSFILVLTLFYCFHKYMSRNYDYWKKRNIYYIEPLPILGNFLDMFLFRTTIGQYLAKLYNQTKEPVFGVFAFDKPFIVIRDPKIIKMVLIKDFHYFDNRTILSSPHDPFSAHMLFLSKNPDWKVTRIKMTPIFTSGKLRYFVPNVTKIGENVIKYINKINVNEEKSLEAKEICAKYTSDVIAKCALGFDAKSFENDNADFRRLGRQAFDFNWRNGIHQTSFFLLPTIAKTFRMKMFDSEIANFFRKTLTDAINLREKTKVKGNDLIDIIIELKQNKEFCEQLGNESEKLVSQAAQFFLAGFETASSTMGFTLYELCLAPELQKRLRSEIKNTFKEHKELTYEIIKGMQYLHMVTCECLRKYPILPFLDRRCNADYKIPGTDITIEKDIPVYIPSLALHYDAEYFPNPEVFDPERFSPENIDSIPSCTYLPFGEGPRNCIGARFGLLSVKVGLIYILNSFEVEKSADTPIPITIEPRSFVLTSHVGFPIKFKQDGNLTA